MAVKKSELRFDDYVRGTARLRPDEQLSLIEVISSRLKKTLKGRKSKHSSLGYPIHSKFLGDLINASGKQKSEKAKKLSSN